MNDSPSLTGRPTPAALALGFCGTALACLLARDLLLSFCGNEPALAAALAVLPLAMAGGARLRRRLGHTWHPADLLAPVLGLLALVLPLSLLALRAVRPFLAPPGPLPVAGPALVAGSALVAFLPLGLVAGTLLALTTEAAARLPAPPRLPLAVVATAGAALGALFVQGVAIPKLSPANAALDAALGCCVAGVLCAAGAPDGRRMETWLSLLAFVLLVPLPLSGIVDERLAAFAWSCPVEAVPTAPAGSAAGLAAGLAAVLWSVGPVLAAGLALRAWAERQGADAADRLRLAEGMCDAGLLVGIFFAYRAVGGNLYGYLPALVAAYAAGQALALYLPWRRENRPSALTASPSLLAGYALGFALPALLALF
ncbi:MAG: hypothetical protein ACP59X_17395 [Solidesulfovibrio sp. DCME]|uniref:hypothetical protein n=1 Tax=Solidesulfovibrio sp. DCME TaxID=3447380 RepID=UPI003D14C906